MLTLNLHPKQGEAFLSPATEILYGGAAGGGKSHLMRTAAIAWCYDIPGLQVSLFRRQKDDLIKNHIEGFSGFPAMLAPLINEGLVEQSAMKFKFWNGAIISLDHCSLQKHLMTFQGAEIHVLMIDEMTQFPWDWYTYLRGRCRLGGLEIPDKYKGLFPRTLCGANPGGVSHNNVKHAFIDSAQPLEIHRMSEDQGGMLRQFIPAKQLDNPTLTKNDPGYDARLAGLGHKDLVRAMREGDWNIVSGGFFDDIWFDHKDSIVVEPFQIPRSWYVDRSFDWGSSSPFSVGWWAESDGTDIEYPDGTKRATVRGDLFRFAEWYGWNGEPNGGLKMLNSEIARGINKRQKGMAMRVNPGPADTQIYTTVNGNSIADDMRLEGVNWTEADKDRKQGWQKMRTMMAGASSLEKPGLYVFETCKHFIRTVPVLQRDDKDPDDVKKEGEDHVGDEVRYKIFTPRAQMVRHKFRGV